MNYQMEVFHQALIDLLNKSGLPIGAAYFIIKDVLHELEVGYFKSVKKEQESKPEETTEEISLMEDAKHD